MDANGTRSGTGSMTQVSAESAADRYKWVVLSNTTLGSFMAVLDTTIMLIALPDIFRGIHINPLAPGNSFYLLWMILSFMVVTSVLVVSLGRLGDMYGRVRMYNLGFAVYTFFSLVLALTWMSGTAGALWLVVMRVFQGVGAALLIANSAAILTDAFPEDERGMALGINQVAGLSGSFIGLILGGLLAPIEWRLIFLVSVPAGLFGTVWAYTKLREVPRRETASLDWPGNIAFALGLVGILVGITYGIQPYGHATMGWTSPFVLGCLSGGVVLLVVFALIEHRAADPMFRLPLFRIRAFTAGSLSSLLAGVGRGGLMFMLIIWLQGIWLPLHGYSFSRTPLWAGIYMLPLTAGFLLAGPASGYLSDRFGSRPFASGGDGRGGRLVPPPGAAAHQLLLRRVRPDAAPQRPGHGRLRRAQPCRGDEQPAAPTPRRGLGNELDLPERLTGALDRDLLHLDDRGTLRFVARHALSRSDIPRGARGGGDSGGPPAAGFHPVRRLPGVQPRPDPARKLSAGPPPGAPGGRAVRPELLPGAHLRAVRPRSARGLRLRHWLLPVGGRHVVAPRRQVPLQRGWYRARPGRPGSGDRSRRRGQFLSEALLLALPWGVGTGAAICGRGGNHPAGRPARKRSGLRDCERGLSLPDTRSPRRAPGGVVQSRS